MATVQSEASMRRESSLAWTGWAGFAALMLMVIGGINFFEGLIAIIRDKYYVLTPQQIVVFDMTTWGWIMLIWGVLLVIGGLGLTRGAGWARWFTIVVVSLNMLAQLGWLGSSQYPLWTLVVIALDVMVVFALSARWAESRSY